MKAAWLTDIHLNFIKHRRFLKLVEDIKSTGADVVFITGDISEAPSAARDVEQLEQLTGKKVYFVLGNHDFYHGSIRAVREQMLKRFPDRWLPAAGPVRLTPTTILIGHDGWADGRNGTYGTHTEWDLNDFHRISELQTFDRTERLKLIQALAQQAADNIRIFLVAALVEVKDVMMLTHIPPFKEASYYRGKQSDDEHLPYYSSKVMGDTLLDVMSQRPDCRLTVLCGHTHGASVYQPLPNLLVKTGESTYGDPKVQEVVGIE